MSDKPKPGCNSLEQYFADDAATEALALIGTEDTNAAHDALLLAAGYIERGEPLPGNLANYLVMAITKAMAMPEHKRAKSLTDNLGLTAKNRRKKGSWSTIGGEIERRVSAGTSPENACLDVSAETGISDRTVKRYWDQYKRIAAQFDADMNKT
jgi:hypothetical protein